MTTAATPLDAWLARWRREVETALERFLPAAGECPPVVAESMRYSLFAGGKRLRPMLVLAGAEAVELRRDPSLEPDLEIALPCACALELIHTYSLVHDDLPAMDNDSLRRGRPTSHVVYGDGMAILAGDALLTEAFRLLAREPRTAPGLTAAALAERKLRALDLVATAAGAVGMVGGQAIDLQSTRPDATPLDEAGLGDMHARKTGALLRAAVVSGAVMAGADEDAVDAVGRYGSHLGLAFQIVDDILDVEGASVVLGKTAGKDAAAGKPTYPARYGLEESRRRAAESAGLAIDALAGAALGGRLVDIARWVVSRTH